MTFGGGSRWEPLGGLDSRAADLLVGIALDAGVNLFDTANVYGDGDAERLLGAALGNRRHDVLVSSKVRARTGTGPNERGLSRHHILRQVECTLQRLGTDYLDLYVEPKSARLVLPGAMQRSTR